MEIDVVAVKEGATDTPTYGFSELHTLRLVFLAPYHDIRNDTMTTLREVMRRNYQDAMWNSFAEGYYKAYEYYEQEKLRKCIKMCTDLLKEDASIPRYIRISRLILLALVVKEAVDFCAARSEAGMVLCVPRTTEIMLTDL
jgi:hypothetical protein